MKELNGLADEQLAALYIEGNDNAFDILLARYQSKVFNYIYHFVKNQEMAEDIFQDTFVKVVVSMRNGNYYENGKFSSWIMRISHNLIMDWHRKSSNNNDIIPENDEEYLDIFHSASTATNENREKELIDEQTLSEAEYLVTLLPETQRQVLRMRIYDDLSFKEIAEKLNISINTALGRMHYAVNNLRKLASEYGMTA